MYKISFHLEANHQKHTFVLHPLICHSRFTISLNCYIHHILKKSLELSFFKQLCLVTKLAFWSSCLITEDVMKISMQ